MDGTGDEWDTDNTKESTHYVGSFRSHAEGQATWLGRETGGGASRVMSVCELGYGSLPCVLWTDPRVEKEQGREPKLHINYTNLIDLQGLFIHQLNHAETTPNVSHGPSDPQAPPLLTHNIFFFCLPCSWSRIITTFPEVLLIPSQMPSSITFLDMVTWLFSISSHCALPFDKCQVLSRQAWPPSGQGYYEHSCALSIVLGNGN